MEEDWEIIGKMPKPHTEAWMADYRGAKSPDELMRERERGLVEYGRKEVKPYVPRLRSETPKYTWIDDLLPPLAKLAGGLTAIGGGVYLAISGLAAAKAALQALILSNPLTSLAVIVCAGVFAFRKKSGNSANPKNEPGSGEWEFYQEQKQGFRKKQP